MNVAQDPAGELLARAERHASRREFERAIACYEEALGHRGEDAMILVQLSYMHSLAGRYRVARDLALRANATGTTSPDVLIELLPRLRTFNAIPELLACIERLLPMSRMPIPLLLHVAAQLSYLNLPERAIGFLDEARRADPDYPPTLLARTQVLIYLGRFDEASVDVARVLRRAPELAKGHWLQAALGRPPGQIRHAEAIRDQIAQPGRSPSDVALLAFALHKTLDDLGRHGPAWDALMLGCRAKRATLDYTPADTARLFEALVAHAPRMSGRTPPDVGTERTPIFIVGMHRSGTTLLEQLLDGSPQVRGIGEMYDFTSAMRDATDHHCRGVIDTTLVQRAAGLDMRQVGQRYLASLQWRLGKEAFFTDKLPSNFLNVGFICAALPHARILHMVRDPMETCFSNLRELFSEANAYSYDLTELADYHAHYRRLMAHWHACWPGRILDVDYGALTREPERILREVCAFVGITFESQMLGMTNRQRAVVTASAIQVRDRIQLRDTPKWMPYAAQLAPLRARLQAAGAVR